MRIVLFFGLLAFLVSCHTVRFVDPQPMGGERLYTYPSELHGLWIFQDEGTLEFRNEVAIATDFRRDSLGVVSDTTYEYMYLTDSLRMFRTETYWTFNELHTNGYWRFMTVRQEKGGAIGFYFCDDYAAYGKLQGLTIDSASLIYDKYLEEQDEFVQIDTVLTKPTLKSLKKDWMNQVAYVVMSGQIRPKDLKKICREEFLYMRLMPDGTVFLPKMNEQD